MTTRVPDTDALARLREPFDASTISKLPRGVSKDKPKSHCDVCGGWHEPASLHLDYVGHADVTDRLLSVDPTWNWRPLATAPEGLPLFEVDDKGRPVGLWIELEVAGMTRLGYGSVETGKPEPVKELIGDAIRNAAMRFGVALDLWKKHGDADQAATRTRGRKASAAGAPSGGGKATDAQIAKVHATAKRRELATDVVRRLACAKWHECEGHLSRLDRSQASAFIDFLDQSSDRELDAAVGRVVDVRLPEEPS